MGQSIFPFVRPVIFLYVPYENGRIDEVFPVFFVFKASKQTVK